MPRRAGTANVATKERHFIGLHAGGLDGIDAALVAVRDSGEKMTFRQLHCLHAPFDEALRRRIEPLRSYAGASPEELLDLDGLVAMAMSRAACSLRTQAGAREKNVTAVGVLGIRVGGGAELGLSACLARGTGLPVVGRFDIADRAAGGNGGAVTAWPAWRLLRDRRLSRSLVHLGEIASVTFVGSAAAQCEVVAYDVGPGTVLLDALARDLLGRALDEGGSAASRGKVSQPLLSEMMAHGYFNCAAPKTTWRGEWTGVYLERLKLMAARHACRGSGLLATAAELTARLVAAAIGRFTERPHEIVLSGGGTANARLVSRIRSLLSPCSTYMADRYGLGVRAAKAVFAAVLAAARLDDFPAHCPSASGATRRVVLGSVAMP
jgi:anhydro-N-acetylmuramic acid kinase